MSTDDFYEGKFCCIVFLLLLFKVGYCRNFQENFSKAFLKIDKLTYNSYNYIRTFVIQV